MNLKLSIFALTAVSFAISWIATLLMKRVAPMIGFVDKPGGRKIHANPKPLGGGVGIFLGFALPVLLGLAVVEGHGPPVNRTGVGSRVQMSTQDRLLTAYWSGARDRAPPVLRVLLPHFCMHPPA